MLVSIQLQLDLPFWLRRRLIGTCYLHNTNRGSSAWMKQAFACSPQRITRCVPCIQGSTSSHLRAVFLPYYYWPYHLAEDWHMLSKFLVFYVISWCWSMMLKVTTSTIWQWGKVRFCMSIWIWSRLKQKDCMQIPGGTDLDLAVQDVLDNPACLLLAIVLYLPHLITYIRQWIYCITDACIPLKGITLVKS